MITRFNLNYFLHSLWHSNSAYDDWEHVVTDVMSFANDELREKYITGLRNKLLKAKSMRTNDTNDDSLYARAIPGSLDDIVSPLINDLILPSSAEEIIVILKDASRIMQVGPGRGRALIIMSSIGFDTDEFSLYKPIAAPALAKDLLSKINAKDKDIAYLQSCVHELSIKNEHAKKRLSELEAESSAQERISWT